MSTEMLQITGHTIYKKAINAHNDYLNKFEAFPLYDTSPQEMSNIRDNLMKSKSIKRILQTNTTNNKGRWLIETTKSQVYNTQKHCDSIINQMKYDDKRDHPSRLNPTLANKELILLSKELEQ